MDPIEIKKRIIESQKKKKDRPGTEGYRQFKEIYAAQLELDPSKYSTVPFGYPNWEALNEDIKKYHSEVINVLNNIKTPGSLRKPVFYKFLNEQKEDATTIAIRIHNIGTPLVSMIECAINADQAVVREIDELLQFGRPLPLVYLYSEAPKSQDKKMATKMKLRTVNKPTIDMLKIRLLWLFRAGYGVSYQE